MREWMVAYASIFFVACGGAVASNDGADGGSPGNTGNSSTATAPGFVPIDTTNWRLAVGADQCSFDVTVGGEQPMPQTVRGDNVVAFMSGTEIPYVVFGCSGSIRGVTYSFLGATISDYGTNASQWASIDVGGTTHWIDDMHIAACQLVERSAVHNEVGDPISGAYACNALPSDPSRVVVSNGTFQTTLGPPLPFTTP